MKTRVFLAVLAALLLAAPAQAATFTVTKEEDTRDFACGPDCSLREAIDAANSNSIADEIVLPPGVYVLSRFPAQEDANESGDLDVTNDVTIRGAGPAATVIFSTLDDRVIDLHTNAADLRLIDLTVTGGRVLDPNDRGGGIRSKEAGELFLERVVVRGNVARGAAANGHGGGIHKAAGPLVINDSAVVGNLATGVGAGGGIFLGPGVTSASLTNVTIAENLVTGGAGGGVFVNGTVPVSLVNTTIARNHAASIGGIAGNQEDVRLRSSIVAGNSAVGSLQNCDSGELTSEGGNVLAP